MVFLCAAGFGRPVLNAQPASNPVQPVRALPPGSQTIHSAQPEAPNVDAYLAWDATSKQQAVMDGTPAANFTFSLTNISTGEVTISSATASCGCTVARLPEQPWKIAAGANGQINVTMTLAGKSGTVPKTVTVVSDKGVKVLNVTTVILPAPVPVQMTAADRESNQKLALTDRQAVFKGNCAKCHAEPAQGKMGQALYVSVCGVCHEAEHRATMVPNLHSIAQETNAEFWKNWITHGKPGSLMPAFSQAEGGILSEEQIASLVGYLAAAIPPHPVSQPVKPQAMAN